MKLVYFAWVRDHTNCAEEDFELPHNIETVGALAEFLASRSDAYHKAFHNLKAVRAAVNHEFATLDAPISNADEVAFFPPVTGG